MSIRFNVFNNEQFSTGVALPLLLAIFLQLLATPYNSRMSAAEGADVTEVSVKVKTPYAMSARYVLPTTCEFLVKTTRLINREPLSNEG